MKRIDITPVTRVEGHAKISIFLEKDGTIKDARFQVTDFRGFEKFCEGRPFYEMPSITSRICGICPVSHLLASIKACDEIVAIKISRSAELLRRLMHMGQIVQSHALSFFYLSSPDFLLGMGADPAVRNIFGLIEKYPEVAKKGIKLRKFGQEIIELLAGKRIHSSDWLVPGGVKDSLPKDKCKKIFATLPEALDIILEMLSMFKAKLSGLGEEVENLGNFPTYYLGLVGSNGELEHYDGKIRVVDPTGKIVADKLDPNKYYEYIGEAVESWSYMKFPFYKSLGYPKGVYRVGPLARLNIISRCGTPLADVELKEFKNLGKDGVVQNTFLYHYARLIEVLFCLEKIKDILEDPEVYSNNVWAKASVNRSEGIGVAEAPRGTLIHHYKVDKEGLITWVNMIIATENNNLAYNMAVTQVAKKYVTQKRLTESFLNRIEAVVRAFDPCLSCATHAIGQMALDAHLYDYEGKLIDRLTH